jgi:glycosyltransferase involved in cell wall biosynthesis
MKVVAMLPFKDEEWILPVFLSSVAPAVDEIVAIDDGSGDSSRRLVEEAGGHVVSSADLAGGMWGAGLGGRELTVREKLLEIARERGGTHFIALDADEALTAPARHGLRDALARLEPGKKLAMRWVTLWKSPGAYRDGDASVWSDLYKDFGFADAPDLDFAGVARTPGPNGNEQWVRLAAEQGAVLHYQFVPWERVQMKQAWYRCQELIRRPRAAFDLNVMYAHGLDDPEARTSPVPDSWLEDIDVPPGIEELGPTWHYDAILEWFDERGIEFFEPLQIWQIPRLHELFVERVGREPRPKLRRHPAQTAMLLFKQHVLRRG